MADEEIQFCMDDLDDDEFKDLLLSRNQEWMKVKDGSSQVNCSLRAVVLGCIDSRVPVEKIFQAKPGELLVLKNAGNLVTMDMLRSMLVAVFELKAEFIVILGHTRCGMAIRDNNEKVEKLTGELGENMLNKLKEMSNDDPLKWFGFFDQGEWEKNARNQATVLKNYFNELVPEAKHPSIFVATYDLDSGEVNFLE